MQFGPTSQEAANNEMQDAFDRSEAKEVEDWVCSGSLKAWVGNFLSNPTMRQAFNEGNRELYKPLNPEKATLKDVGDGTRWAEKTWFQKHVNAIAFQVYMDDAKMSCPVGQRPVSLLNICVSVANVDKSKRGHPAWTFVHSVTRSENVQRHGIAKVLQPLVDQLQEFVSGVYVDVYDENTNVKKTKVSHYNNSHYICIIYM